MYLWVAIGIDGYVVVSGYCNSVVIEKVDRDNVIILINHCSNKYYLNITLSPIFHSIITAKSKSEK